MSTAASSGKRTLFSKDFILIILANTCAAIGFYFVQPTLPRYVTSMGFPLVAAGILSGMFSLIALVFRPITGIVADRISPKLILCIALPMEAIAGAFYGLIPSTWWLVVCRTFHGIGFAFAGTVFIVYASLFIPIERMGEGVGYLGLANVLGTAVGPSLGLGLGAALGYKYSFVAGGIIIAIAFVCLLFTRVPSHVTEQQKSPEKKKLELNKLFSVKLIPLSFMNGLFSLTNGIITAFLSLHADNNAIANIGLYFTILAIVMLITRPFTGKLNDKKGLGFIAIPGFIFAAAALVLIAVAQSFTFIVFAAILMALGQGSAMPAFQTACIRALPEDQRGVATSTYFVFADVFNGIGPVVGSSFATMTSPVGGPITYLPMFSANSMIMGGGLIMFIIYAIVQKKRGVRV